MNDPTLPAAQTGPVLAGLDWAGAEHAVCVLDTAGAVLWRPTVTHSRAGLARLVSRLTELRVPRIGIERPDGPVIEALPGAGLPGAVVPPRQVKNLRSRYRGAGKDDRFDAQPLADAMRPDGHRFADPTRDSAPTTGLRALVRAGQALVEVRVGLVTQLRSTRELALPGAVGLFFDLHSPIARAFLRRFPTAVEAAALDEAGMAAWLTAEGYCGRTPAGVFIDRRHTAPAGLAGSEAAARRHLTLALLAAIDAIEDQAAELTRRSKEALAPQPAAAIFTSPPRAGQLRAAALPAEIGDARGRYPDPDSLAAAAGVCPVTIDSGNHRAVGFGQIADLQLRRALTDFADHSRHAHLWAADLYARARGMRHPHAVRVLARAWTGVIWRCWQAAVPYDPAHPGALNRYLNQSAAAAA